MRNKIFVFGKLIFLFSLVFQGCKNDSPSVTVVKVNLNDVKEVKLSTVVAKTKLVKLGNRSKGSPLFYPVRKLVIANDRIFVYNKTVGDFTCKIFFFDKNGNFITTLNDQAGTPNNINSVTDMCYSENKLELLDFLKREIKKYDKNGLYVGSQPTPEMFTKFTRLDENYVLFDTDNAQAPNTNKNFALLLSDNKGNQLDTYLNVVEGFDIGNYDNSFFEPSQKTILHWRSCDPTIYEFDKYSKKVFERYKIDYGNLWLDSKKYKESTAVLNAFNYNEGVYRIGEVIETEEDLIIFNTFRRKLHWIFFNKKTEKTEVFTITENDIDGGIVPILPPLEFIPPSTVVFVMEPEVVLISRDKKDDKSNNLPFMKFAKSFRRDDNPPLLYMDLKKSNSH